MSVLLVDWLGRGGIAQTTEAWAMELRAAGRDAVVLTRSGRELGSGVVDIVGVASAGGGLRAHRSVAAAARRWILEHRPAVVVVQNYVLPFVERPVHDAARSVGARVVLVVHDHRLHSRLAGAHVGLRRLVAAADTVVAHTSFVATHVAEWSGRRDVAVLPHPVQIGMLHHERPPSRLAVGGTPLALHFGVIKRGYKGTDLVAALARRGVGDWRFAVAGVGAAADGATGLAALPGFLAPGELCAAVEASAVTLLPYRLASQSGAVVLGQALGSVPVASAVGGIPEQITDGVTGRLLPADATVERWAAVLDELADPAPRGDLAAEAQRRAWEEHRRFVARITELTA